MPLNAGHTYVEKLGPDSRGVSLAEYLAATYRHSDLAAWRARIEGGEVSVDGRPGTADQRLVPGQIVAWQRPPWHEKDVPTDWRLLHEDAHVLAVAKPRGLPTMPAGGFSEQTLFTLVRATFPEATPLHRLGRDTTGIVLFARTDEARRRLSTAWRECRISKQYRALAQGVCAEEAFEVTAPIGPVPHAVLGSVHAASPRGRPSLSRARVLERREDTTLFAVDIATGRPHQIRIHLAFKGFSLAGDPLYVAGGVPREGTHALPGDGGYLLHAERIAFEHPADGREMVIRAPPPDELLTRDERGKD